MECPQTDWLSDDEYLRQFARRLAQERVPFSGSIALTHRCNLRCVHCYLGPQASLSEMRQREMSTEQVLSVIDQVVEAGCLMFLITGGEPLLRQDFAQVYRHAKTRGLLVTVFTNGTTITDEILDLFADLPPHAVEMTVYGATAATYERITGVKGSFARAVSGIERLLERGIHVRLKTILMTLNRHEFFDIEKMADEYGVKFRFDASIFARMDGDKGPTDLRVSPEEAVAKETAGPGVVSEWREYYERKRDIPAFDRLYNCGAGLTTFHVDPYGALQPCIMTWQYGYDLAGGSFEDGWRNVIPRIRERKPRPDYPCSDCDKRVLCGLCPAFFRLDTGAEDVCSEYLCAIGHLRYDVITRNAPPEGNHERASEQQEETTARES